MKAEQKKIITTIRRHYGNKAELRKVIEELIELSMEVAISVDNPWINNRAEILAEMTDVYIVLEHLKEIMNFSEQELDAMIWHKIIRQINRISNEDK